MIKRYITILRNGRWLLQKDICNDTYAIFYKWNHCIQQVSHWYIKKAWAIKRFNLLTEEEYNNDTHK